jgi:hypothetical protein
MKSSPNNLHSPISAPEWRFAIVVGCIALLVTSVPYCLAASIATPGRVFGGFVYATEDCYAYLAHMNEGAHGDWLFTLPYTPETHSARLFYLFHLLLGHVAALLPFGDLTARMVWVYHAARWIFGLGLLLTVYRFIAEFTPRVTLRRLAWLMVTFGGGLGWLLVALGQSHWLGSPPLDFILPEGFTFLVLYAFPHIALARTLLLWGVLLLLWSWLPNHAPRTTHHVFRVPYPVLAGAAWLLMGLVVPFYVVVAWAVTGAAWIVLGLRNRRVMWREAGQAAIAVLVSCPVVLYSAWVFTTDPVYEVWSAQNLITSPNPLHYLTAYGLPLVLAAFALRDVWREERPMWLALAWVGVVPLLVYLPFSLQRRLVEGVQIPLSILAAWGLWQIANHKSRATNRPIAQSPVFNLRPKLITIIVLVMLSLTNILLVAGNCLALRGQPAPIYRGAGEIAALDWLRAQAEPTDVVLSSYETGNYLPARVWARAFVGHGPETVHSDEKRALASRFFDVLTDDGWRYELLIYYGVDYVFWGPAERRLGDYDPRLSSYYLWPVYDKDGYLIFRVAQ